jgi:hypothetical protein
VQTAPAQAFGLLKIAHQSVTTFPGVMPDVEMVANTPSLFLESEAPAAGMTVVRAKFVTLEMLVLTLPLSPLCAAA